MLETFWQSTRKSTKKTCRRTASPLCPFGVPTSEGAQIILHRLFFKDHPRVRTKRAKGRWCKYTKEPPCRVIEKSRLQDVAPILPCSFRRSVTFCVTFSKFVKFFSPLIFKHETQERKSRGCNGRCCVTVFLPFSYQFLRFTGSA